MYKAQLVRSLILNNPDFESFKLVLTFSHSCQRILTLLSQPFALIIMATQGGSALFQFSSVVWKVPRLEWTNINMSNSLANPSVTRAVLS